jgi:hypothetical protein
MEIVEIVSAQLSKPLTQPHSFVTTPAIDTLNKPQQHSLRPTPTLVDDTPNNMCEEVRIGP